MASSDDAPNALSPYYPSEVPSVRGNGRWWVAALVVAMIGGGALAPLLAFFL